MDAHDMPITPGPELTVAHAESFRERLLARIAQGGAFPPLDLGAVERFDSAGVQLLLSLRRTLATRHEALCLSAASELVADTLSFYGLHALLPAAPGADRPGARA